MTVRRLMSGVVAAGLALSAAVARGTGAGACGPAPQDVRVRVLEGEAGRRLELTIDAAGLREHAGALWLELDGWGGWADLGTGYVEIVESTPPLAEDGDGRYRVLAPQDWNGAVRVTYTVPLLEIGGEAQRARSVLPAANAGYAVMALANTVMRIDGRDGPIDADRTMTVEAAPGESVVTGWGGEVGGAPSALPRAPDNGLYAIGRPLGVARSASGPACEVYQFTGDAGVAERVLRVVEPFVAHVSETLGAAPPEPVRVFVGGTTGGGYLTDHGVMVGLPEGTPPSAIDSAYFRHLICHELYHTWVGGMLREAEPERTVWFKEGFTDYLSLWHAAACGVIAREWLVERMTELEPEALASSVGEVAFTDPGVSWRDGDGPNETMAYKGGAVLAFALDAELRRSGHAGLAAFVREMLESGETRYSGQSIVARLRALGLGAFARRHITGTEPVRVGDALDALGVERVRTPTELAYLGLRVEDPGVGFGRIAAIDPAGPAAGAGFLVGDIIGGYAPARTDGVVATATVETEYPFGLGSVAVHDGPVSVWVHRDGGEAIEVRVRARAMPGGEVERLVMPERAWARLFE